MKSVERFCKAMPMVSAVRSINAIRPGVFLLFMSAGTDAMAGISHGPVLGALSDRGAAIWIRTDRPEKITLQLGEGDVALDRLESTETIAANDNTYVFRLQNLKEDTNYRYTVSAEEGDISGVFKTLKAPGNDDITKIAFGSCYAQDSLATEKGRVFRRILDEQPDAFIILGDLPYSDDHDLQQRRQDQRLFRENRYFSELVARVPVYTIWDDHDFGTNNIDGSYENKAVSLKVFNEYWPNPENENRGEEGIYTSFVVNNIEVFLLDTRYFSAQSESSPALLGETQFAWLCDSLQASRAKYKIIASGVPLASRGVDGWGGRYFKKERERLFACIDDREISGVMVVSGDLHRTEVHRFDMGGWFGASSIYDFSSSPLSAKRIKHGKLLEESLVYFYDREDSLFSQIVFNEDAGKIEYSLISPDAGRIKTLSIADEQLNINASFVDYKRVASVSAVSVLFLLLVGMLYRRRRMAN